MNKAELFRVLELERRAHLKQEMIKCSRKIVIYDDRDSNYGNIHCAYSTTSLFSLLSRSSDMTIRRNSHDKSRK